MNDFFYRCEAGFSGERCHLFTLPVVKEEQRYSRTTALAVMAVVLSLMCLTIIGILLTLRYHKKSDDDVESEEKVKLPCSSDKQWKKTEKLDGHDMWPTWAERYGWRGNCYVWQGHRNDCLHLIGYISRGTKIVTSLLFKSFLCPLCFSSTMATDTEEWRIFLMFDLSHCPPRQYTERTACILKGTEVQHVMNVVPPFSCISQVACNVVAYLFKKEKVFLIRSV